MIDGRLKMMRAKNKLEVAVFDDNEYKYVANEIYNFFAANVCIGVFDELNLLFDKRTQDIKQHNMVNEMETVKCEKENKEESDFKKLEQTVQETAEKVNKLCTDIKDTLCLITGVDYDEEKCCEQTQPPNNRILLLEDKVIGIRQTLSAIYDVNKDIKRLFEN
jgi:hypothetical protein